MKKSHEDVPLLNEGKLRKKKASIHFDCGFTFKIRKLFRKRRETLGLSYNALAQVFDVNWSTIRKWEIGKTKYCNLRHRLTIEKFLNGEMDELLLSGRNKALVRLSSSRNSQPKIESILEQLESTYRLCVNKPELREHMCKSLSALSIITLKKLLGDDNDNNNNSL